MPKGIEISLPDEFKPSTEDMQFASAFHHIAELLQKGEESERLALRISTCRNAYLTANALFADLRMILGHGAMPAPVAAALRDLERGNLEHARALLATAKEHLSYFNEKVVVWEKRAELDAKIQSLISTLPSLAKDEVQGVLNHVRSGEGDPAWDRKYYELTSDEPLGISPILELLRKSALTLQHVVEVAQCMCLVAKSSRGLFAENEEAWTRLYNTVLAAGSLLGIQSPQEGHVSWQTASGSTITMRTSPPNTKHDADDLLASLSQRLDAVLRGLHETMAKMLRPNVGVAPLPRPFLLDLSCPRDKPTPQSTSYSLVPQRFSSVPADTVRIALVDAPVPLGYYRKIHMSYSSEDYRLKVRSIVEASVDRAHHEGAQAVCFPEYFLPRPDFAELAEKCRSKGLVFIGGVEGVEKPDGVLCSQAVIALPETSQLYFQDKHTPSGDEPTIRGDGRVQVFESTKIGNFAVILCSDFLEIDLIACLARYPGPLHHLFVCTCNPYGELFVDFARSDCYRVYSNVYVVNNQAAARSRGRPVRRGVTVVAPQRDTQAAAVDTQGFTLGLQVDEFEAFVHVAEVSLDSINGALCEKPRAGALSVPKCRRVHMQLPTAPDP